MKKALGWIRVSGRPGHWAAVCLAAMLPVRGPCAQADAEGGAADGAVVRAGAGGYLTAPPRFCRALPETIYRTADVKGPTPTGQWWSSLVWQRFSQPLFAHPLAMRCISNGLAVWYPGATLTANKAGIFGAGSPRGGDFTLGHSAVKAFTRADCGGFSDWFVTAVFAAEKGVLRASFGHGSPYVFCRLAGGNPTVTFSEVPRVWSGGSGDAVLGVTANGRHYGLFGASGSTWSGLGGTRFVNDAKGKDYFAAAVLPEGRPETLARFCRHAHSHVTGTRLEFAVEGGAVTTTYRFELTPMEGDAVGTFFALYPHQWKHAAPGLTPMVYGSVRGTMKVGEGLGFTTKVPVQGVLPLLPSQGIADRERVGGYLREEAEKAGGGFGDTYGEGKRLGKLATLSGVAEAAGLPALRQVFLGEIRRRLEEWFTARPAKEQPVFYYDARWGVLVGSRPSFGTDRPLNDHHFHYGYFIRAAAEVARVDPAWAARWGPMAQLLIRDIASPDRGDAMFPRLRCFDGYAGHSWASGDAAFADGNNQESSSEAMNAWYGMILWGQFTGDATVRDTGVFLFNTERTAVEEYWFDVSGTNFPDDFPNVALGMVWGGKGAFGTWFSGDIDCIHGINWLPFTPASLYLGRHPDYVRKNHDRVVSARKAGRDYNTGWGDLVCMFNALQDPDSAAAFLDATPRCRVEGGNTRAFMHHWIHTLKNLGLNDGGVTADHPLACVFSRAGRRTYAAYNAAGTPLTVTFSDGTVLNASPRALTVQP
ncbi:MAG: glycoside hydrolase family 81 [Verrucomicrobia bacterium]|nr:glycoside hydrolase family 81 [Verrucomicrobiota bacterium]